MHCRNKPQTAANLYSKDQHALIIASYYVLFAVMVGHSLIQELLIASVFGFIALLGAYKSLAVVGLGIVAHGFYDLVNAFYFDDSVAPVWWPVFCAAVDLVLGFWVIYLSRGRAFKEK